MDQYSMETKGSHALLEFSLQTSQRFFVPQNVLILLDVLI